MRRTFLIVALLAIGLTIRPTFASAETYQCVCLKVPAQDCSADASMLETGITVESSSKIEADNPPNCQAKCATPGSLCDACTQCVSACNTPVGKTCQLWWEKKEAGSTPSGPVTPSVNIVKLTNPLDQCPENTDPKAACHSLSVPQVIANLLKTAMGVVGALALLIFIYGGFKWLTSGGEAAKISAGKEAMKWAAIGLVIIFTSYALIRFVFSAIAG